jgi:peptidoglycan/LPS O-acetylase OafA/YrhL
MVLIMRALIGLLGLFTMMIGLTFLLMPLSGAASFFISPVGTQGLATIRADFPGFFIGASVFALYAAWRARGAPLLVPLILIAIAFLGRIVSIIADGTTSTTFPPMIAELLMMVLMIAAYRVFGHDGQRN